MKTPGDRGRGSALPYSERRTWLRPGRSADRGTPHITAHRCRRPAGLPSAPPPPPLPPPGPGPGRREPQPAPGSPPPPTRDHCSWANYTRCEHPQMRLQTHTPTGQHFVGCGQSPGSSVCDAAQLAQRKSASVCDAQHACNRPAYLSNVGCLTA